MIVMDRDGNLFDERRKGKDPRRKKSKDFGDDKRKNDRRVEDINATKKKRKK